MASEPTQTALVPELKMWCAVRVDIGMSVGKTVTQGGHAYQWLGEIARRVLPERYAAYLASSTPKITVKIGDEAGLYRVKEEADKAGIPAYLVVDAGRTELSGPTPTVCAFGPAYREDLPPFLKRLQLL